MGIDVGVEDGSRIEITFEEVNNENINVELIDNPVTIELETPPEIQVAVNEIYSDVNVILDHNKQINRNLNKQHTAETIQESTSKRFTSDTEISNLEPKKGADEFYVSGDEKNLGALATGVAEYPTIKQAVDKLQMLAGNRITFSEIPNGAGVVDITNDINGNTLTSYNIKQCIIEIYTRSPIASLVTGSVSINGVYSGYKQPANLADGFLFRLNAEAINIYSVSFANVLSFYGSQLHSPTVLNDTTGVGLQTSGINRAIANTTLQSIRINPKATTMLTDSYIVITKLA